ncbi:hypothetical protein G647_09898 [Cladophialophora carrionii CBS 160.54]|uniref:Major facilitator superfamily (MFS) profile domain-containing protein n=1 Tax=Cladophialophora carrionii CBS 160.54 TaxID=1279043 RepID=V9DK26_9EURO|nr:uncharacterized protein G647_09898 [Cladophialophora carrionii CBS 160.54]ETI27215.1 hypothetical protein G647_09898 [Cladophialophora carrionii CBS 160.54]
MSAQQQTLDELKGRVHLEEVVGDGETALTEDQKAFLKKEKRVVRKLDLYITPVMLLLMLISYLDRGNIGFAATQGMTKDIGLKANELSTAVSIFYLTYILSEFPTTMYVKRLQFQRVIPVLVFSWGLVCMCMGFIQNYAGLIVCRLLLGTFEGCLFPSMTMFLLNWYKREEVGQRVCYLYIGSALSGAFGGLIAFGILYMDGTAGYPGWRWLYIIEGIITIAFAFVCYFLIPQSYATAYFFNDEDKAVQKQRLELMEAYSGGDGKYTRNDVKNAMLDIKTWLHGINQILMSTIIYGFGTFLPIILRDGFNYSTKQAQYFVIPVQIVGAVCYFIVAVLSDRYKARFVSLVCAAPLGIAGYAVLLTKQHASVWYGATYLIAASCYIITGTSIAWHGMNIAPDGKRAAAMGVHLGLANIGGIIAGQIYRSTSAPRFLLGHGWSLASIGLGFCIWWILFFIYKHREAKKARMEAEGIVVPDSEWTDRSPGFKYQF